MGEKAIFTGLNLLFYLIWFLNFILELELFLMSGTRSLSLLIYIFFKKAFYFTVQSQKKNIIVS